MSLTLNKIHDLERDLIECLNSGGWNLKHTGSSYLSYDAIGYTKKGFRCVIEMKFREKYYEAKMIETYKYNKLMGLNDDILKFYYVSDPKGYYLFLLNNLKELEKVDMPCPKNTLWNGAKQIKSIYLLKEGDAIAKS